MKVLFVCLGNICRSPAAEAVFLKMAVDRGLEVQVDSAGTSAYHAGDPADARMSRHASERGYELTSRSRPFVSEDFESFELILTMDESNYYKVLEMAPSEEASQRVKKMTSYCEVHDVTEVA